MKKFKIILITLLAMILLIALPLVSACDTGNTENNTENTGDNNDKDHDDDTPDVPSDSDDPWVGNWKSLDGSLGFSIAADGANVIENDTKTAATISAPTDASLTLTTDEKTYALSWYEGGVANKIVVLTQGNEKTYFIPAAAPAIGEDFGGTWYDQYAPNTLTVDAQKGTASFNGKAALAVVDCGLVETWENNDGSTIGINHQCLYLIMEDGGDIFFVGWYKDSTSAGEENGRAFDCPTVTTPEDSETPLTFRSFIELYVDEDLDGTWRNAAGSVQIVVDAEAKTVKVGGKSAEVYNNGGTKGSGNIIVSDGTEYRLEPDPGYNYFLTREKVVDVGMGQRDYFLKSDHDFKKVENTYLQGTEWDDLTGAHKLSVAADGTLTYDKKTYTVFVSELLSNGIYKAIAVSADNAKVEISYEAGAGSLTFSDGVFSYTYYKANAGGGTEQTGFLGLTLGVHVNPEGKEVEVTADSLIIKVSTFDYYDDEDITVTMDMLTEADDPIYNSSKHYTFTWKDVNDTEHTMHIALDLSRTELGQKEATSYKFMIAFGDYEEHFFVK